VNVGSIPNMTSPFAALAPRRTLPRRPMPVQPRPDERSGRIRGRVWINGREVGGTDARYAHLSAGHD
jgi:hypothetical protein